jgi:hypothetical protein
MIFFTSSINQNYLKLEDALVQNDPNAQISVEAMIGAVSSAGGIVAFMKKIAAGANIAGIDRKKLGELWNQKTGGKTQPNGTITGGIVKHREALKDLFRAAMPDHHEWIPSNMMLEVIDRDMDALNLSQVPEWIDLQHNFRIKTQDVVFGEQKVLHINHNGKPHAVFQGHVGAKIILETVDTSSGDVVTKEQYGIQDEFHNDLRDAFKSSTNIKTVKTAIKSVAQNWIWNGKTLPLNPLHPGLRWRNMNISKGGGLSNFKTHFSDIYVKLQKDLNTL